MTNNQVLKAVTELFLAEPNRIVEIFANMEQSIDSEQANQWLTEASQPDYKELQDKELSVFLNGLIADLRGQKEGPLPEPDKKMSNNLVLKKLKIALDLQNEDVIEILASAGLTLNKYELTGFLRKTNHKNYRFLKNQDLKSFFQGLEIHKEELLERLNS